MNDTDSWETAASAPSKGQSDYQDVLAKRRTARVSIFATTVANCEKSLEGATRVQKVDLLRASYSLPPHLSEIPDQFSKNVSQQKAWFQSIGKPTLLKTSKTYGSMCEKKEFLTQFLGEFQIPEKAGWTHILSTPAMKEALNGCAPLTFVSFPGLKTASDLPFFKCWNFALPIDYIFQWRRAEQKIALNTIKRVVPTLRTEFPISFVLGKPVTNDELEEYAEKCFVKFEGDDVKYMTTLNDAILEISDVHIRTFLWIVTSQFMDIRNLVSNYDLSKPTVSQDTKILYFQRVGVMMLAYITAVFPDYKRPKKISFNPNSEFSQKYYQALRILRGNLRALKQAVFEPRTRTNGKKSVLDIDMDDEIVLKIEGELDVEIDFGGDMEEAEEKETEEAESEEEEEEEEEEPLKKKGNEAPSESPSSQEKGKEKTSTSEAAATPVEEAKKDAKKGSEKDKKKDAPKKKKSPKPATVKAGRRK